MIDSRDIEWSQSPVSSFLHLAHSQKSMPSPGLMETQAAGFLSKFVAIVVATAADTFGLAQHKR